MFSLVRTYVYPLVCVCVCVNVPCNNFRTIERFFELHTFESRSHHVFVLLISAVDSNMWKLTRYKQRLWYKHVFMAAEISVAFFLHQDD